MMFPISAFSTSSSLEKEFTKSNVGLLTIYTDDEHTNKISLTIQNILEHYLNEINQKITLSQLTDKYKDEIHFAENGANKDLIGDVSEIGINEGLDTILIIGTSSTLNSIISTLTIIKPKREIDNIVYKNVFQINLEELEEGYPPDEIIKEINNIINAVISVKISITTNAKQAQIFINDRFISYAEPDVEIIASIGVYELKIISDGYETLIETLIINEDKQLTFTLDYKFFNKKGLAVAGMFDVFEAMFWENKEKLKLSTSYSFQYFFTLFNHGKFYVDFNLVLLNVTRINTAKFMDIEFETNIEVNSLIFSGNIRYEPVFERFHWLNPILGLGIGIASHSTKPRITTASNLSFNIIAGVSVNFHRRWSVVAEYRYLMLGGLTFIELVEMLPGTDVRVNIVEETYNGSVILIGMRYNL